MPTVPRIGLPQVQRQKLPGVRISPDTGGAFRPVQPIDLQGVKQIVQEVWKRERQKADQIAVLDADSKLAAAENELLYHPEKGALTKKGKDAFDVPEQIDDQWLKTVDEISKSLGTDEQRAVFAQRTAQRYEDLSTTVQRHVFQERQTYDKDVTESFLDNERNSAMANYTDPKRIATSIERQSSAIVEFGRRNGWSPDKVKVMRDDAISKTHTGVVNLMLADGNDLAASEYVKQHKGEIVGPDSVAVQRSLQEGSLRGESQRQADKIVHKFDNRTDALQEADKIKDPKVRDATRARVNDFFSERRAIKREIQEDLYLQATNMLDAAPSVPARITVPPHIWSKLDLSQRTALENRSEGGNLVNNDRKWMTFLDLRPEELGAMSQAEFETQYWSSFDKAHRERASLQWAAARDALKTGQFSPASVSTLTFNDRVLNTIRLTGIVNATKEPSKWNKAEVRASALFEKEAAKRVNELNATKGKGQRVSGEEIQEILDKLAIEKIFISNPFRFGDAEQKLLLEVTEDEHGKAYVPYDQVPLVTRNALINTMKSRGTKQTKDKVSRAYAALLLRDGTLLESIVNEK